MYVRLSSLTSGSAARHIAAEVSEFLTRRTVDCKATRSTQHQALSALLLLYRHVLEHTFGGLGDVVRAKRPGHVPVVLTHAEAQTVLAMLDGRNWLIDKLLYGSGLRIRECLRLRVKDLDCMRMRTSVHDTKGKQNRFTMLPRSVVAPLQEHLKQVRAAHKRAMREDYGNVEFLFALAAKYPKATCEAGWPLHALPQHVGGQHRLPHGIPPLHNSRTQDCPGVTCLGLVAIIRLWDDPSYYEEISERCRTRAEMWRPSVLLPPYIEAFE
ncbi:MAG: tyrosine-type recombinase/integrase, partial [Pirellulaceae bacterium]